MFPIVRKTYKASEIEIDPHEVLRYLGYKKDLVTAEDLAQVEGFLPEACTAVKPAACWGRFEVELLPGDVIRFPYGEVKSADLARNLRGGRETSGREVAPSGAAVPPSGAAVPPATAGAPSGVSASSRREIFIFATTIGLDYDRLVQRAHISSMAKASFLNAIGAAAVENVCDQLNEELRQLAAGEGKTLRPRYSAGYGDFTLENQRGIFDLLTPSKYIGLTLKDNLIMVPEKSVTAVIGIGAE